MRTKFKAKLSEFGNQLMGTRSILTLLDVSGARRSLFIAPLATMVLTACLDFGAFSLFAPFLDLILEQSQTANNLFVKAYHRVFSGPPLKESVYAAYGLVVIVGLMLVRNFSAFTGTYLAHKAGLTAIESLRSQIFTRYMKFGLSYYEVHGTGKIKHSIIDYPERLSHSLREAVSFVFNLIVAAGHIALLFYLSWPLTLATLILIPALSPISGFIRKKVRIAARSLHEVDLEISKLIVDACSAITFIKANNTESTEAERFQKLTQLGLEKRRRVVGLTQLVHPIIDSVNILGLLTFCFMLVYFRNRGWIEMSPANALLFIVIMRRTSGYCTTIYSLRGCFDTIEPQLKACVYLLRHDSDKSIIAGGTRQIQDLKSTIEFRNLTFGYRVNEPIVSNLNLTIRAGETLALVGATGAGKSTLVKLLLRFYDCPEGTIFIDGQDIREIDVGAWRKMISYVGQDIMVINSTVRENLVYGIDPAHITEEKIQQSVKAARLTEFVQKLPQGLDTPIGERGVCLSNGERQRICIAHAILKDAPILIMDEATSALDTATERDIQSAVNAVLENKTAIVIAHRLSTIKDANRIAVVSGGRIKELGSLEELVKQKGEFAEFWNAQKLGSAA